MDLESYAEAKGLPVEFLRRLGLETVRRNGTTRLAIPYRDAAGEVVRVRYRDGEKSWWGEGNGLLPYGLDRLPDGKAVILVEGESDCHALWHAGLPALGIPGAASWKAEWAEFLAGRRVYAWQEPDQGGKTFIRKLATHLPDLLVVVAPDGAKDPGDLHCHDPDGFRAAFLELLTRATPAEVPGEQGSRPARDWLVFLSDVKPKPVRWLWHGRIPLGKLTVCDGDPGLGKSTLMLDVAARVSTGREMPGGGLPDFAGPAGVVFMAAEDGLEDTVRPRLDVAEADCSRIAVLNFVLDPDGKPAWPSVLDVDRIEEAVERTGARLIVVDPLVAYLPGDSHRDQDVRAALADLVKLADRLEVAVVCIRHLRKSEAERALYRGGGSIGIIAAARSGLLVAQDPTDPSGERRVLLMTKSNVARMPAGLTYVLHEVQHPAGGGGVGCIVWGQETTVTPEEVLSPGSAAGRPALEEAMEFLREELKEGPVLSRDIKRQAQQEMGISADTLKRAKTELEVEAKKAGGRGEPWYWMLPEHAVEWERAKADGRSPIQRGGSG